MVDCGWTKSLVLRYSPGESFLDLGLDQWENGIADFLSDQEYLLLSSNLGRFINAFVTLNPIDHPTLPLPVGFFLRDE